MKLRKGRRNENPVVFRTDNFLLGACDFNWEDDMEHVMNKEQDEAQPDEYGGVIDGPVERPGVHMAHCFQGEYSDTCKYGYKQCPAKPKPDTELLSPTQEELRLGRMIDRAIKIYEDDGDADHMFKILTGKL